MKHSRLFARSYGFDLLIVIAAIESAVEVALRHDALREPRTAAWFTAPAVALLVLALLARRRFPFAAPVFVWVFAAALSFVDGRLVVFAASVFLAGMAASLLLGNLRDDVEARVGLAVVVIGATIVVSNDPNHGLGELFFIPVLFAMVWVAGFVLRERVVRVEAAEQRAVHAERELKAAARIAVAEERARIARELHDIVAHAVSVMVLQVGAVRHRLPAERQEDRDALSGVEHAGRAALGEMRHLLDAMRDDGEGVDLVPQPGLESLDGLLEEVGRAGLPVRLQIDGDPLPLPRGIDISAYRIVQEGLTNALKHAHATHAEVAVHYTSDELRIDVRDNGEGGAKGNGQGHGLIGIRERVKLYGGEMSAGPASVRGFNLSARLPVRQHQP